jgi:hypothetical protein
MRYLLRRVRFFFFLTALGLGFVGISMLLLASRVPNALETFAFGAAMTTVSAIYAVAWWTTRKPSPYRNNWAILASILNLILEGFHFWRHHFDLLHDRMDVAAAIVGIAGLYAYGTGGAAPGPDAAQPLAPSAPSVPAVQAPVAGDCTVPLTRHLATVVSLAGEYVAIYYWAYWARAHGLIHAHAGRLPWYILFTAAFLITTIIHECGHALLAWCFQMRLLSFNAGPFRFRKQEGKWNFRFVPEGLVNLGGAVRVVPTDLEQPPAHYILMIAAGPMINLLTGAFLLVSVLYTTWPHFDVTWRLVAFTASFSFLAAIVNLIPFRTADGGYSDGAQIVQILTRSPVYEYNRVLNSLAATLVTGRRYKDLDINAMLYAAGQFPFTDRAFQMQLFASNYYLDTGRIPDARKALTQAENIVAQANLDIPGPFHTDLVFKQACLNRNAPAARAWWDKMEAKKVERKNIDYWLARASLHWIEGNRTEAEEAYKTAEAEAAKLPHFGAYEFDRFRLSLLRQAMDDTKANMRPAAATRPSPETAAAASRTAALAALATAPVPRSAVPAISATILTSDTLAPASSVAPVATASVTAPPARIRSTAPSASSPALAAAANSPEAPAEPRWDPLSFIRNPSGA